MRNLHAFVFVYRNFLSFQNRSHQTISGSTHRTLWAVSLNDLHVYDPAEMAWTDLSFPVSGTPPSPRQAHGFTSASGKLYVHGGLGTSGERVIVQQRFKAVHVHTLAVTA